MLGCFAKEQSMSRKRKDRTLVTSLTSLSKSKILIELCSDNIRDKNHLSMLRIAAIDGMFELLAVKN